MDYTLRFFYNEKRKGAVPKGWNVAIIHGAMNCGYFQLVEPTAWNSCNHLKLVDALTGQDMVFVGYSNTARFQGNVVALTMGDNKTSLAIYTPDTGGTYIGTDLSIVLHKGTGSNQPLFIAYVEPELLEAEDTKLAA